MTNSDSSSIDPNFAQFFSTLRIPQPDSHKGQNGKVLIIGGSELFHAASKWSLDIASKFVDMVFYASVPSNNELIRQAKGEFWNGLVIELEQVPAYIEEADCILIGPGMTRTPDVAELTNRLLKTYPDKKWVVDAGALQMVDPQLLNEHCIVTPHHRELVMVCEKLTDGKDLSSDLDLKEIPAQLQGATIILKGHVDTVANSHQTISVAGGNAGMTKGGTGDVLAGLVAALYATNDAMTAAVVASYVNKKAGDELYKNVGPFFNASELVEAVPKVLWGLFTTVGFNAK
jgi:NAD(P)H-hydrate epimerase